MLSWPLRVCGIYRKKLYKSCSLMRLSIEKANHQYLMRKLWTSVLFLSPLKHKWICNCFTYLNLTVYSCWSVGSTSLSTFLTNKTIICDLSNPKSSVRNTNLCSALGVTDVINAYWKSTPQRAVFWLWQVKKSFRSWNAGNLKPFGFLATVIGNRMWHLRLHGLQ